MIIIRLTIRNFDDVLCFDKQDCEGEIINVLIETFDELFISNKSMTFNCEGIDVSIETTRSGMMCTTTKDSFAPWFICEYIVIYINPGVVDILGLRDDDCVMQSRIFCDEDM